MSKRKILYVDLDNVLCNFSDSPMLKDWTQCDRDPSGMLEKGFFLNLEPIPGALAAIHDLLASNMYDIYILTQPVSNSPRSYSEKASWVLSNLPDLKDKIILTQNKGLQIGDILIDDSLKWKKVFLGEFIHFSDKNHPYKMWVTIVEDLLSRKEDVE